MMNKMIIGLLAAGSLVFSLNASAGTSYASPTRPDTISSITVGSTGNIYVYMNNRSRIHNPANCKEKRYTIKSDHPVYDYFYVQLLLTWKEGYDVNFNVFDDRCLIGGIQINRFNVTK